MKELSLSDLDSMPILDIIALMDRNGCEKQKLEDETKTIKLYEGFPVDCHIQKVDEDILILHLTGAPQDIERVYFGVWNNNGTSGELYWNDDSRATGAVLWTKLSDMEHFFYFKHFNFWGDVGRAWDYAGRRMRELKETHKQVIDFSLQFNYDDDNQYYEPKNN